MKKIIFYLLLLNITETAIAQTYLDFPPQGNLVTWLYNLQNNNHNGTDQYQYRGEDTVISGYTYKKIYYSYYDHVIGGMGFDQVYQAYNLFHSYIRQDSAGVIYTKQTAQEQDNILFDLSIQVGDTIPSSWIILDSAYTTWYTSPVTVTLIDTLYDNQNIPHRVYHFDTPSFVNREFIEGIGCTYDFDRLLPSGTGAPLNSVRCVSVNGVRLYPFSGSANCTPLTAPPNGINEYTNSLISIFPNPTSGTITVANLTENATATIMDATGRIVLATVVVNNKVDVSSLANGVYVLRIETGDGLSNFRILKQ